MEYLVQIKDVRIRYIKVKASGMHEAMDKAAAGEGSVRELHVPRAEYRCGEKVKTLRNRR